MNNKAHFGKNNGRWKGGIEYRYGYRLILAPNHPKKHRGKIREHIITMEKHLGRYLNSNEIVHHINHIRDDNRLDNLKLMDRQTHQRFHRYLRAFSDHMIREELQI